MNTKEITAERLAEWTQILADANATPFVLIGIGHGSHSGDVILCIPNNVTEAWVTALLRSVEKTLASHQN